MSYVQSLNNYWKMEHWIDQTPNDILQNERFIELQTSGYALTTILLLIERNSKSEKNILTQQGIHFQSEGL